MCIKIFFVPAYSLPLLASDLYCRWGVFCRKIDSYESVIYDRDDKSFCFWFRNTINNVKRKRSFLFCFLLRSWSRGKISIVLESLEPWMVKPTINCRQEYSNPIFTLSFSIPFWILESFFYPSIEKAYGYCIFLFLFTFRSSFTRMIKAKIHNSPRVFPPDFVLNLSLNSIFVQKGKYSYTHMVNSFLENTFVMN